MSRSRTPWLTGIGVEIPGMLIDDAGFARLEEAASGRAVKLSLSPAVRDGIKDAVLWARRDLRIAARNIPTADVLAHFVRVSKASAGLATALAALDAPEDEAAGCARDVLQMVVGNRIAEWRLLTISLATVVNEIVAKEPPEPAVGCTTPALINFIVALSIEYEKAGGELREKVWYSRTTYPDEDGKTNKPDGPFFRFIEAALKFVPEADEITPEALANKMDTARTKRLAWRKPLST